MITKIDQVLNLISEKSRDCHDSLDSLIDDSDSDIRIELITQISLLDELYNDVKLIKFRDV